jgi:glycosyltransferase involved in cell wall biosynthesis
LDGTSPPRDLSGLERPLIGHVGLIDDYISFSHLLSVADALERGTLVLVGGANVDTGALEAHPRVVVLGPRPYAEIRAYLHAFACCLVPFTINRLTVGVNPIKLREYLAAGRPVVATPLPELVGYGDVVTIADTPGAYARAVLAALAPEADTPERRRQRRDRVAPESWDAVAARIEPLLVKLLDRSG